MTVYDKLISDCSSDVCSSYLHASQNGFGQDAPLFVADGELLREISQYAQAVGTRVDHEVDAAFLPFQVKGSVLMENSRDDRVHALVAGLAVLCIHKDSDKKINDRKQASGAHEITLNCHGTNSFWP